MILLIHKQFLAVMKMPVANSWYRRLMAGRPSSKKPTETGARLAALRQAAGLSQAQLADAVGIPQRTLSFYEREGSYLPSHLITPLAKALGVSVQTLLGSEATAKAKRGPKSRLERQFEAVSKLPPGEQELVSKLLERFTTGKAA
jgi:transcriptional regulator with XRE-family HTH domain